jgi:hypothetical protein
MDRLEWCKGQHINLYQVFHFSEEDGDAKIGDASVTLAGTELLLLLRNSFLPNSDDSLFAVFLTFSQSVKLGQSATPCL